MEKQNQRIVITKRLLHEALIRILNKKELSKVTITELCQEAGVNRVTFYRHYETPHDVLMEMERDMMLELKSKQTLPRTQDEVRLYMEQLCDFLDDRIDIIRIMVQNNTDNDFLTLFKDLYRSSFHDSRIQNILKTTDPEVIDILLIYTAGGGLALLRQWLLGNIRKTPHEIASISYELLCNTDWSGVSKQFGLQ